MKINKVLLTGATGFLGSHILSDLLQEKATMVYCLVRARDQDHANKRIAEALKTYGFLSLVEQVGKQIIPLIGDLGEEKLGIENDLVLSELKDLGIIIHSAALVKHLGNKGEYEKININAVQQLIDLALETSSHFVHISTTAVAVLGDFTKNNIFTEDSTISANVRPANVYLWSKILGEDLVINASKKGLSSSIMRVGHLTGRYKDGVFQKNESENATYARLKIILKSGIVPQFMCDYPLEMTPVDACSKAIMILLRHIERDKNMIYHLNNNYTISYGDFSKMLEQMGYSISVEKITDYHSFKDMLSEYSLGKELITGYFLIFRYLKGTDYGDPSNEKTMQFLKPNGFDWPKIDTAYIDRVIKSMSTL